MPVRKGLFPARGGLTAHRRLDYGRLLRTHVLDTRTNRSDQVCNDGKIRPCPPDLLQSPEVLGRAQEAWLDEGRGNDAVRSEERRVGKEGVRTCRYRVSPCHKNKKQKKNKYH